MKTKQLTIDAMMAAMCAVLGYLAIDLGTIKITFENLPVIIAGLVYGPIDGLLVGGIGSFIYQMLRYGWSATTLLWMLPSIAVGIIAGLFAKQNGYYNSKKQLSVIVLICELAACALNTVAIYVDSKIFGYYQPGIISGAIVIRLLIAFAKAVAYSFLMIPILTAVAKYTHKKKQS